MENNSFDNPVITEDQTHNGLKAASNISERKANFHHCNRKNEKEKESNLNGTIYTIQQKVQPLSEKACIDYDPYQHIQRKNSTSYWDTIFHLLKASLGTGILAMPNAFRNAGYAVGLIGTLFIGFLCTYNIHILVTSEYELCRRKKVASMTYPKTVQAAFEEGPSKLRWFAPYGRFITNVFLVAYQIGTSSIYTVFIASNLKDVYDTYYGTDTNVRLIMTLYLLGPSILISWIRNLKLLVPFSTIANAATVLSFILIFRYVFDSIPSLAEREPVGTIRGIPLFFGTVLFAMEAIGMVMPLKNQMKKPKKFNSLFGVLNASMLPISLLYAILGFFGYLKYGDATDGSVTLNLPKDLLAQAVKLLYAASIFISYALSNYVTFDIIWNNGIKSRITTSPKQRIVWEYVVRTAIAFLVFFLAVAIPNLEIFISFVGAFCLSCIGVAFPAIIQILVFWYHHDDTLQFSIMVFKNFIIILIAILAFTIGVSTSVIKLFNGMT